MVFRPRSAFLLILILMRVGDALDRQLLSKFITLRTVDSLDTGNIMLCGIIISTACLPIDYCLHNWMCAMYITALIVIFLFIYTLRPLIPTCTLKL